MNGTLETPRTSELRVALPAVVLAAAILAAAVWAVPVWLGNDAPAHLFGAFATVHYHDEALGFARYFELNRPLTARGFFETYQLFDPLLPWPLAYRLTLIVIAELWALAFLFAATAFDARRWPVGLAGFALALGWAFDLGLFSYWMACAGVLLVVGTTIRFGERRWLAGLVALLLYVTASAHVFPAIVAGVILVVIEAARSRGRRRWWRLALMVLAGAPAAALALLATDAREQHDALAKQWGSLGERVTNTVACTLSGPWWRWLPLVLLGAASVALLIARRRSIRDVDAAAGGLGLVLLSLAVATPLHLRWMFFAPRFAPLGLALVVLVLPVELVRPRARVALALAVVAWVAAACWWSAAVHRRLAERVMPALGLVEAVAPMPARRLAIAAPLPGDAGTEIRYLEPLRQVGQLLAIELGGMFHYGLVGAPTIHPQLLRDESIAGTTVPPVAWLEHIDAEAGPTRRAHLTRIFAASTEVDEVVLLGTADDVQHLEAAGFVSRLSAPGVVVARFQGCAGSIIARGAPGAHVELEIGWWPLLVSSQGVAGTLDGTGHLAWDVDGLTCDDLWVRPREGRCANGDANGYVRGRLRSSAILCALPTSL